MADMAINTSLFRDLDPLMLGDQSVPELIALMTVFVCWYSALMEFVLLLDLALRKPFFAQRRLARCWHHYGLVCRARNGVLVLLSASPGRSPHYWIGPRLGGQTFFDTDLPCIPAWDRAVCCGVGVILLLGPPC